MSSNTENINIIKNSTVFPQEGSVGNSDTDKSPKVEKSTKPKDPLYFKKYYLEKMKGVRYNCEVCKCSVPNENKTRHFKSQKHIRNLKEKSYEHYSEFD